MADNKRGAGASAGHNSSSRGTPTGGDVMPQSFDSSCRMLATLGRAYAYREGVPQSEVEDCEMEFVERMLEIRSSQLRGHLLQPLKPPQPHCAWLHVCARNHARNYRRAYRVRAARHLRLSSIPAAKKRVAADNSDPQPPQCVAGFVVTTLLLTELLDRMRPDSRTVFVQFYVAGDTIYEIAAASGRSVASLEQALHRTRCAMRLNLVRRGLTEADLREGLR